MWIDTHCHLNLDEYDEDRSAVRQRAEEEGVEAAVLVGIDVATSRRALELAADDPWLHPSVGVHPHDALTLDSDTMVEIDRMAEQAVAVGETGLDYFRMHSPMDSQRDAFRFHIETARDRQKPLVIHCREAHDDILDVLRSMGKTHRGVMHCFSGDLEFARACLALGLHISIAGPVTYPKAEALREVVPAVPVDRLLLETDCPFLAPQAVRGKRNEPSYIRFTGEMVAHLRGLETERLAEITTRNARELFGIPAPDGETTS